MADPLGYLTRFFAADWRCRIRSAGQCLLTLAVLAVSNAVSAQTGASQIVRFTVFAGRPIAGLTFVPKPNGAPQKLAFYPTTRSPRYEYRGAMPLRFLDDGGAVVAEAQIPPTLHDAFLLFLPVKGGESAGGFRYTVAVLDDSATSRGPGGLAIINLSGLALGGTVNRTNVTLKPGLNPTLAVGSSARVTLRTTFKGKSYQSYAGTFQLTARQRALLILFPPFYAGSLEAQSRLLLDEPGAAGR